MTAYPPPIARGPLVEVHRKAGAGMEIFDGWEVAMRYVDEPLAGENALIDLSNRSVFEIAGPGTHTALRSLCGQDVPNRVIHQSAGMDQISGIFDNPGISAYRLTDTRAIVISSDPIPEAIDVSGGWASVALFGPVVPTILTKVAALDLRQVTFPVGHCCQGAVFGVSTLFGRFTHHFELHVCPDSLQFLWEVLLDAGSENQLKPAGLGWIADCGFQTRN